MQSRGGMESSAETTNIWEMVRSGFACPSRTLPLAISVGAGRDIDTSSANRAESRRDPHSTSERERTLHDWKSRLPAAFPDPCHLLVRASVLGETAKHRRRYGRRNGVCSRCCREPVLCDWHHGEYPRTLHLV